jgi:hypothetical protein
VDAKKQVRHNSPARVRVVPESRENPDVEKLARALISIAKNRAEERKAEEPTQKTAA